MKRIVTAALSLSLLATGTAFAAPPAQQDPHAGHPASHTAPAPAPVPAKAQPQHATPAPAPAPAARPQPAPAPQAAHSQHGPQHAQPAPRKGERLAQGHRGTKVSDYKRHGLRKPGRGQEWRKVDNRYLLIAAATGIIADIVTSR